jgi:hypothetical protein
MFVDDEVIGLRLELVNDIRIPCVADQNPTFPTVGARMLFPTLSGRCFKRFGESGAPKSERCGRKAIFHKRF